MVQFRENEKKAIVDLLKNQQQAMGNLSNARFAARIGVSPTVITYIYNGEYSKLSEAMWLKMAQYVRYSRNNAQTWRHADTKVSRYLFTQFEVCQNMALTAMLADEPGIGKTHCMAEYARTHADVMCVDCSVSNTRGAFIRAIAQAAGCSVKGKLQEVLDSAIYAIGLMDKPLIILDESGDLEPSAMLQLKKLYNALEMRCGFYMMGSDGFKKKLQRGVEFDKLGFTELFSRFDKDFKHALSDNANDRLAEFKEMAVSICRANGVENETDIRRIIADTFDGRRGIGDLRRVKREIFKLRLRDNGNTNDNL